ncbi:MAG: hypothetical protein ACRDT6_14830 [Micromonosporaceae bacterium]
MSALAPILLLAVAGMLAGGAWSLRKQGAGGVAIGVTALLAVLAFAGGVLWLLPEGFFG